MTRPASSPSTSRNAIGLVGVVVLLIPACGTVPRGSSQWRQWGGPNRNFMVDVKNLADKWPDDGPKKVWERELGDGYSTIAVDDGMLYTMYRVGEDEFAVALDAKTGRTVWEHKNPSPTTELMKQFGPGPHTTPTVVGNRVYTIGTHAMLTCFEKKTGKVVWQHDLEKEMNANVPGRGYGASPIAYKNTLIVLVDHKRADEEGGGGDADKKDTEPNPTEGQAVVAFDLASGRVVWKSQELAVSYASPILVKYDGREHLVCLLRDDIIGLSPDDGQLLWRKETKPQGANISTPVFDGQDTFFCSSAYDSGARAIKLTKKDGKIVPEELWYSRKMRVHHGNVIRLGDYVYGSSGDFGPAFFMGINLKDGSVAWRERGFAKATCVYADDKLIILDEDGQLALAKVDPKGLNVLSKCKIAERTAWAAPTLVGSTLYIRDRKHIMALDLPTVPG